MPINKYFSGHGDEVMHSMRRARGGDEEAAKREFYATANSEHAKPGQTPTKRKGIGHRIMDAVNKRTKGA